MSSSFEQVKKEFTEAGQQQVLSFYDSLPSQEEKDQLLKSLSQLNPARCNRLYAKATKPLSNKDNQITPLPNLHSTINNEPTSNKWKASGMDLIAKNKVAVILLAGGQGTRLGSADPKGMYNIGLPSQKSLFQLQAERILRIQNITNGIVPWYIMTSEPTRQKTESFFIENNYFGIDKANIMFFNQGVLPAFDKDGKIFMETKSKPFTAPDGNGGIYAALRTGGVLEDLKKRDIPYIHAYCVDNCLVKVADPTFVGYCVEKGADCGAKVVPKSSPEESVGVICLRDGKYSVVEYSEISKEMSEERDGNGKLVYGGGNIANHFYTREFLESVEEMESDLEYHVANKKIKHVDFNTGEQVSPSTPNGIKLELFIFDVFPFTKSMAVLEVARSEEFSPLKNAPGSASDCPETSRKDILDLHSKYLKEAGATVTGEIEISPLWSYDGEGLEKVKGKSIGSTQEFETIMKA